MRNTTGPRFDPGAQRGTYFQAVGPSWAWRGWHPEHHLPPLLVEAPTLASPAEADTLDRMLEDGATVMLDSGIFGLAMRHARAHRLHMDDALTLPPDRIDGFAELWDTYAKVVERFSDRLWGMVELDQGGAANKRPTRKRIEEELGIVPIPVYHPLLDGWEYFDELAAGYDRLCVGNIVQASTADRARILHTAWQRSTAYPDLWVHLLGVTPNPQLYAFPQASCDSSSLINPLRYGRAKVVKGGMEAPAVASDRLVYRRDAEPDDPTGYNTAVALSLSSGTDLHQQWHGHLAALERNGIRPWAKDQR